MRLQTTVSPEMGRSRRRAASGGTPSGICTNDTAHANPASKQVSLSCSERPAPPLCSPAPQPSPWGWPHPCPPLSRRRHAPVEAEPRAPPPPAPPSAAACDGGWCRWLRCSRPCKKQSVKVGTISQARRSRPNLPSSSGWQGAPLLQQPCLRTCSAGRAQCPLERTGWRP